MSLDQSSTTGGSGGGGTYQWQSFTVGIAGTFARFEWYMGGPIRDGGRQPIEMKLYEGEGVAGTLLHTSSGLTSAAYGTREWIVFDLSTIDQQVQIGEVYTVLLTTPSVNISWIDYNREAIPGAKSNITWAMRNHLFKTYVSIPPTCFPAGTPIQTDQGVTAIDKLVPGEHTLRGKNIIAITQTRPLQKHIVCFEKDSIGKNVPSQQTLCSKEHKVLYQGEMIKARDLADMCKNVKKVSYNGETLYNVLLEKDGKMLVNNMICETLHPENIAAKIAKSKNSSMIRSMKR